MQELMRDPVDTELEYFKNNPTVTGMATEDNKVILNPYSKLSSKEKEAVALNEAARVRMRTNPELTPNFELTPEQTKFLNSNTYSKASDTDRKATIAARILSGDPSAGTPTEEQNQFVDRLYKSFSKKEEPTTVPKLATGGIMNQSRKMLQEGGVMQEGGTQDPVSGNAVPPGAMQEEVRDDIDAKLSEGEFVFPADVVRYFGLQKLMAMRDEAKTGLQKMNEIGQMGNADQVSNPEALYSAPAAPAAAPAPDFGSEVDMALAETGSTEQAFAYGGTPDATQAKTDTYVNAAGQKIYVPMSNGNPIIDIPMGFNKQEEAMQQPVQEAIPAFSAGGLAKKRKKK